MFKRIKFLQTLILIFMIIFSISSNIVKVSGEQYPVNLIIVFHMHQPWYYDSNNTLFILPWVRMHSVGNYFKMADILSQYPNVKISFTFSGSLLSQILAYQNGTMDTRLIISWKIANGTQLTVKEKFSMLEIPGGFFDINWDRIVNKIPMYKDLLVRDQNVFNKYSNLPQNIMIEKITSSFNDQDYINLAVLFNLFWIDPSTINKYYPDLETLRNKALTGSNFSRSDLSEILRVQGDIMRKVLPLYKQLALNKQIELVEVPYSHPLMPIIADLGWNEDLRIQIQKSRILFNKIFNITPVGAWPPEEAVNDYVAKEFLNQGFKWIITDDNVLSLSGVDISNPVNKFKPYSLNFNGSNIYVFFRDHSLSDKIGFDYSKMNASDAVNDFITTVLTLSKYNDPSLVYIVALDGENPWENYVNFGDDFLNKLYSTIEQLQIQGKIRTLTPKEYINMFQNQITGLQKGYRNYLNIADIDISNIEKYQNLPTKKVYAYLAESSWSGSDLKLQTWIGNKQQNSAWMWLKNARSMLINRTTSLINATSNNPLGLESLLRAEASDWFFWYSNMFGSPQTFDPIFKGYLKNIYVSLNITPPSYLFAIFYPDGTPIGTINTETPPQMSTPPTIDGVIMPNEWQNTLNITVGSIISNAYIGFDNLNIYLGLTLNNHELWLNNSLEIGIYLSDTNGLNSSPWSKSYNVYPLYNKTPDLGLAITSAVVINQKGMTLYIPDGNEKYIPIRKIIGTFAFNKSLEISLKQASLGIAPADKVYIAIVTYIHSKNITKMIEMSSKLGMPYFIEVTYSVSAQGNVVFTMDDPEGDDKGPGSYTYPKASVFKPGVFDLRKFTVTDTGNYIQMQFTVANLGGNPWGGPNGFSLQYFQVYVHTKDNYPGNITTIGLNVVIDKNDSWQFAVLITPGWAERPPAIVYPNNTQIMDVTVKAMPATNSVIAMIPKKYLPNISNENNWRYVVILTSYDGYGPQYIRPFSTEADQWTVGGADPLAVLANVVPRIMDLLAPTAEDQYSMLKSYNATAKPPIPATLHAVGAFRQTAPTITMTKTETTTITSTATSTLIKNYTQTLTSVVMSNEYITFTYILSSIVVILVIAIVYILIKRR